MKKINILLIISLIFMFVSCFKDEGNYNYETNLEVEFDMRNVYVTKGKETEPTESKFTFKGFSDEDFTKKLEDLSYEWIAEGGIVLSTSKNFDIHGDIVYEKLGKENPADINGNFVITEKSTGKKYMHAIYFKLQANYSAKNYVVLSENGVNSKLSYIKRLKDEANKYYWEIEQGIFEKENGEILLGKPLGLVDQFAKDVSSKNGAFFVFTDKVGYVINNDNMKKHSDIKDEFTNGLPDNFKFKCGISKKELTLLISQDGKAYERIMSDNYLGGKFITTPYPISDPNGYEIEIIGNQGSFSKSGPLYDKKNNRLLGFSAGYVMKGNISPYVKYLDYDNKPSPLDITALSSNIKVLAISEVPSAIGFSSWSAINVVIVYKNLDDGKVYVAEQILTQDAPDLKMQYYEQAKTWTGENQIGEDSKILISSDDYRGYTNNKIYYTKGDELRFYNRTSGGGVGTDALLYKFNSEITVIKFQTVWETTFPFMLVGCANGDVLLLNIKDDANVFIQDKGSFNVGGKVQDIIINGNKYETWQ